MQPGNELYDLRSAESHQAIFGQEKFFRSSFLIMTQVHVALFEQQPLLVVLIDFYRRILAQVRVKESWKIFTRNEE